jgi:dTMP kinase
MGERAGLFIVLEGLDGAGTTTQAERLHNRLTAESADSFLTFEPTDGPIGSLIRELLSGGGSRNSTEQELALLFAADRLSHSRLIEEQKAAGVTVVCDRYVYSSMAYQSLAPDIGADRVVNLNEGCSVPDVTFFVSVPVDECLRRISGRNENRTVYERRDLLAAVHDNYQRLASHYTRHFGPLVEIDGARSVEEVHQAIVAVLGADFGVRFSR